MSSGSTTDKGAASIRSGHAPRSRPADLSPLATSGDLRVEATPSERSLDRSAALFLLIVAVAVAAAQSVRAETAAALLAWTVGGASFFALARIRPGRRRVGLEVAIEVSLATGPILILALFESPSLVASGTGVGAYYVALALAALRLRGQLLLLAGAIAVVQYGLIHLLLVRPAIGSAVDWQVAERLAWLALFGGTAAIGSRQLRRLALRSLGERRERDLLQSTLGRYVSREVAEVILRQGPTLATQRRTVTVLFCDLRGFTFLCERERPEDVVELLNAFYEQACAIVEAHGGTVNKLLGDGLLALFGAPNDVPDHADAAAETALGLTDLVAELRERGGVWTHLAVGIGLDTGEVVLGPIGSRERAEYTAIGSPVNRAARLQSLAERENRRIIVSHATRRALRGRHRLVSLGAIALKGFAAPEEAYYLSTEAASGLHPRAHTRRGQSHKVASLVDRTTGVELTPTTDQRGAFGPEPTNETQQMTRVDPAAAGLTSITAQSGDFTRVDPMAAVTDVGAALGATNDEITVRNERVTRRPG